MHEPHGPGYDRRDLLQPSSSRYEVAQNTQEGAIRGGIGRKRRTMGGWDKDGGERFGRRLMIQQAHKIHIRAHFSQQGGSGLNVEKIEI